MAIIACKECDHSVSDHAVSCPSCGAPVGARIGVLNRSQRILIGALLAFAALSLVGVTLWIKATRTSAQPSEAQVAQTIEPPAPAIAPANAPAVVSAAMRADPPRPRAIYQTTAERLYQDYLANGVATQSKIDNSLVRITGKVAAIDEDAAGNPVVRLAAIGDAGINMTLGGTEIAAAAQLSRGQTVDIQCEKMRRVLGSPEGSGCSLAMVQGGATPLEAHEPAPSTPPAIERHRVNESRAEQSRSPRQSAPATLIAMVPSAAPAEAIALTHPAAPTQPAGLNQSDASPQAEASSQAEANSLATQSGANVATPLAPPERGTVSPMAPTPATAVSSAAQAAPTSTTAATAGVINDDLATVRAADPQAADHIASYCAASASASGGSGAATCRRDEREAYTRLVLHNEFPALDDATRRKCSQPPFPDSYRAKEICAKYELRIY